MSINWNEIDSFASEDDWSCVFGEQPCTNARPGAFSRQDVAEVVVVFAYDGENLGGWDADLTRETASTAGYYGQINIYGVFKLKDGRFGYVEGWADTTGWGCQDGNAFVVAGTLEDLIPKMGDEGRLLLGFAGGIGSNVAEASTVAPE